GVGVGEEEAENEEQKEEEEEEERGECTRDGGQTFNSARHEHLDTDLLLNQISAANTRHCCASVLSLVVRQHIRGSTLTKDVLVENDRFPIDFFLMSFQREEKSGKIGLQQLNEAKEESRPPHLSASGPEKVVEYAST
ncbi:unnamed protein product, partial [Protopolystoma xenopodis]